MAASTMAGVVEREGKTREVVKVEMGEAVGEAIGGGACPPGGMMVEGRKDSGVVRRR